LREKNAAQTLQTTYGCDDSQKGKLRLAKSAAVTAKSRKNRRATGLTTVMI
jgi:hypothetical protein